MMMSLEMWPTDNYIRLCSVSIGTVGKAMIAKPTKIQANFHIQYLWTAQSIPLHCRISFGEHTLCHKVQFITHLLLLTSLLCILHKWSISSCYLQVCQSHNKICLSSPSPNAKLSIHLISSCNYFVWILQQKPSLFLIITHCGTEHAPDLIMLLCVNLVMKTVSLHHYPMPNTASIWEQH
jgi:hypothetical protein